MRRPVLTGPLAIILLACGIEVLSMLVVSSYPSLIPVLQERWQLSNTEAGLILLSTHEATTMEAMKQEARTGIVDEGGTSLQLSGDFDILFATHAFEEHLAQRPTAWTVSSLAARLKRLACHGGILLAALTAGQHHA